MQEPNTSHEPPAQAGHALLRLWWMIGGNAITFGTLAVITINKVAFPSILDGVVWLTVALTILARHLDITRYQGTTADGEPATLTDWRRHAVTMILAASVGTVIAHMLGQ